MNSHLSSCSFPSNVVVLSYLVKVTDWTAYFYLECEFLPMSVISVLWICAWLDAQADDECLTNHRMDFPSKELPFRIAVLGFTCISWSKKEMWAQLSHHPLISWPTTQWPAFSPSVSDSEVFWGSMEKHLSYSYFCCLNRVVLPEHNEFVSLFNCFVPLALTC